MILQMVQQKSVGISNKMDFKNIFKKTTATFLMVAGINCGDTTYVENNYGPNNGRTWDNQEIDNACNSPLFGAHMWNIWGCDGAVHMNENCEVGVALDDNKEYDYSGGSTYDGLKLVGRDGSYVFFDPEIRFIPEPQDSENKRKIYERMNEILDRYNGHVLSPSECDPNHIDDCVYIPESRSWDIDLCMNSPYFLFK
jgi:hypothetical protein